MARAFVAVLPPEPVLEAVGAAIADLRERWGAKARWAPREQWHLTLRFLGDHVDLDDAAELLSGVSFAPLVLQLGGVGAFARPTRATVLWLGVAVGCAPLIDLAGTVRDVTATIMSADDKPYRPHLTVARFERPADVRTLVQRPDPGARSGDRVGPEWTVGEIALVESMLGRGPARHRVHTRIAAAAPDA